jgi:1,4-alpha-glucan branching enzyme
MTAITDETGCPAFTATALLDESQIGQQFHWGVIADTATTPNVWIVATEVPDANSAERHRTFTLQADAHDEHYWFVTGRRFGAQIFYSPGADSPAIRFSVWAPNAQNVEVVFGVFHPGSDPSGYISDDGAGIDPARGPFPLFKCGGGVWETDLDVSPELARYVDFLDLPYMFRITNEQGAVTYKTDIYSRSQIGCGRTNPGGGHYAGAYQDLNGIVSCSVVSSPDLVTADFDDTGLIKTTLIPAADFWAGEFTHGRLPPDRIEDLIIYELHVGSLGYPSTAAGDFADAIAFVNALSDLGVNAVELLPVLEFDGDRQWGYGSSHFFCLQSSAGGANQLKHFVRACHQKGIAVILDVVYNHFSTSNGERSEWGYDSDPGKAPEHNLYTWYEGRASDYPSAIQGYVNNGSSGFAPRYWEENVRQMFTSSAAALIDDFHIDGVRVDLTGAIHQDNSLNVPGGREVASANLFGIKLLRELAQTVKFTNPRAFVIAEDHTGWSAMTQPREDGGIGFDAIWYADFYHHLSGDGNSGDNYARLIRLAGFGDNRPLRMDYFAGALEVTKYFRVAYHESHDEAGNGENTTRTIVTAVNGAPLVGQTRRYAEARARFAYGMSALSAGTPMFLMGEEIGAAKPFTVFDFFNNKEDLIGERTGAGRFLFRFYQDLNRLTVERRPLRTRELEVLYTHDEDRIIAFRRSAGPEQMLVVGSLNNEAFDHGYVISGDLPTGVWKEVFNSDAAVYNGDNIGNDGVHLQSANGQINVVLPANGFVVLQKLT